MVDPTTKRLLGQAKERTDEARRQIAKLDLQRRAERAEAVEDDEDRESVITGIHNQIAQVAEAVKRVPQPSAPEIHLTVQSALPSNPDSTPPALRAAWRYRGLLLRVALALLAAVGAGGLVARLRAWLE